MTKLLMYIPAVHHQYFQDITGEGDDNYKEFHVSHDLSKNEYW